MEFKKVEKEGILTGARILTHEHVTSTRMIMTMSTRMITCRAAILWDTATTTRAITVRTTTPSTLCGLESDVIKRMWEIQL